MAEKSRVFWVVIVVALMLANLSTAFDLADTLENQAKHTDPPLHDWIHSKIDARFVDGWWLDIISSLVGVVFPLVVAFQTSEAASLLVLKSLALIYGMRLVVVNFTVLPKSDPQNNTGFDFIFSGHTATFATGALALAFLSNKKMYGIAVIVSLAYAAVIAATRRHYTIDVVLALVVAVAVHAGVFYDVQIVRRKRRW